MKSIKIVLLLLLTVSLTAVVLQNQETLEVRFLWLSGEVPGIILLFLNAAAGFITGIIVTLLMQHRSKH